jgi:hypothetical protein
MSEHRTSSQIVTVALSCLIVLMPGCSWQNVPPPPPYEDATPIPLVVGVMLAESQHGQLGPRVIAKLKEMNVFQYVIWPYQPTTPVDAVLHLSIDGAWKTNKGYSITSAVLVGLTLGLLGPFLGPKMTGDHDVEASLVELDDVIVEYEFHVETVVTRGITSSKDVAQFSADESQTQKIAVGLANRLDDDRVKIVGGPEASEQNPQ